MLTHLLLYFFTTFDAIVCVVLVLAILMQRSKQDGIGAAFGSGITDSMFGAQTSTVLVRFTSWLTAIFFLLSIILAHFYGKTNTGISPIQQQIKAEEPATPPASIPVLPAPSTLPGTLLPPVPQSNSSKTGTAAPIIPAPPAPSSAPASSSSSSAPAPKK